MTNQLILLEPDLFDTAAAAGSAPRSGRARSADRAARGSASSTRSASSTPAASSITRSSASRLAAGGGRRARVTGSGGSAAAGAVADRSGCHSDDEDNEYHLDDHTRAVGRAGLAAARQALADAVRRSEERREGPVGDPSTRIAA
jgi:hypothetical protein